MVVASAGGRGVGWVVASCRRLADLEDRGLLAELDGSGSSRPWLRVVEASGNGGAATELAVKTEK